MIKTVLVFWNNIYRLSRQFIITDFQVSSNYLQKLCKTLKHCFNYERTLAITVTVLLDPDEANDSSRVLITAGAAFVKGEVISESTFSIWNHTQLKFYIQVLYIATLPFKDRIF